MYKRKIWECQKNGGTTSLPGIKTLSQGTTEEEMAKFVKILEDMALYVETMIKAFALEPKDEAVKAVWLADPQNNNTHVVGTTRMEWLY
ncbi:hypothetical protein [Mycoplasmopsis glycophila]|uniref:Uncharacterized protein n=1 Tax=Mycoplasmopsis glycophila TaxID=171285 RepID=A0A449AUV0_9BACT|nr:hypothetical protein [Mycoplasmopsis glycophila]VEU70266.1 Uncharacterised protein [Mycoplasmopsis glycophila]